MTDSAVYFNDISKPSDLESDISRNTEFYLLISLGKEHMENIWSQKGLEWGV